MTFLTKTGKSAAKVGPDYFAEAKRLRHNGCPRTSSAPPFGTYSDSFWRLPAPCFAFFLPVFLLKISQTGRRTKEAINKISFTLKSTIDGTRIQIPYSKPALPKGGQGFGANVAHAVRRRNGEATILKTTKNIYKIYRISRF